MLKLHASDVWKKELSRTLQLIFFQFSGKVLVQIVTLKNVALAGWTNRSTRETI